MARTRCFPYTLEFTAGLGAVDRPILPELYLIGQHGQRLRTQPYVDMGADFSVYPASFARLLGLQLEAGKPLPISGLYGSGSGYLHVVQAELLGHIFGLPVIFVREEQVPAVLGRASVLEHFWVEYRRDRFCIRRC
jgi:hypothetical protein